MGGATAKSCLPLFRGGDHDSTRWIGMFYSFQLSLKSTKITLCSPTPFSSSKTPSAYWWSTLAPIAWAQAGLVMIIALLFCVDVKWQALHQSSSFPKHFHGIDRRHQTHLKTLWCDSWDIQVKVYLAVSRHYPAQPFCPIVVLAFVLGNFLVARICTWHHFLGVWLYSNYTIDHQNSERVLCLILPSCLVKSVSSTSILHCQSFLQECI